MSDFDAVTDDGETPAEHASGGLGRRRLLAGLGAVGVAGVAGAGAGGFAAGRATAPEEPIPMVDPNTDLARLLEPFKAGLMCDPVVYAHEWDLISNGEHWGGTGTLTDLQDNQGNRMKVVVTSVFSQLLVGNLPETVNQDALAPLFIDHLGFPVPLNEESLDEMRYVGIPLSVAFAELDGLQLLWAEQCVIGLAVVRAAGDVETGIYT